MDAIYVGFSEVPVTPTLVFMAICHLLCSILFFETSPHWTWGLTFGLYRLDNAPPVSACLYISTSYVGAGDSEDRSSYLHKPLPTKLSPEPTSMLLSSTKKWLLRQNNSVQWKTKQPKRSKMFVSWPLSNYKWTVRGWKLREWKSMNSGNSGTLFLVWIILYYTVSVRNNKIARKENNV